jgi:hypothetical protein
VATTNKYLKGDLPIAISVNIPTALVRYQREDFAADYSIGNTPWLSAASDVNKISRITTTYQKERIDQSTSAGEQSLSNWWLRSATSWHLGAGERYYDADSSDLLRFYESNNIDVWTLGQISLLPATTKFSSVTAKDPVTVEGGTFYIEDTTLKFYNQSTGTSTAVTLPAGVVPQRLTTDGVYALLGANLGVYEVDTSGTVRKLWNQSAHNPSGWTVQAIGYVKERIIVGAQCVGHSGFYELARNPSSPPDTPGVAQEIWEYEGNVLTWNSITEFGSAVVAGYTIGAISRIQAYTINTASPLSALNEPIVTGELPRGETLNQIRTYLNEFVVIATSKGIRIGTIGTDQTSFTYGPLNVTGNVSDLAFDGSYVYGTRTLPVSGTCGLWRIDLGQVVGNGYAYASDLVTDSVSPTGVAFIGNTGRKFITSTSGVFLEEASIKAQTGYIKSGWIRWGTSENKQPVSLAVRSQVNTGGTIGFTLQDQEDQLVSIGSIPLNMNTEIGLSAQTQPADHFEITFNFTRNTSDTTKSPILEEWQIRALPAPLRSRTITIPLLCYEEEKDDNGVTRVSNPWERVNYLERIEQHGGAVLYQDFSSNEERVCVIKAIQFEQTAPPTFASGFGGIVTVQLQTIDTELAIE